MQLHKCKTRSPTPLPGKLYTFPTFSDTEDLDSATCNELSLLETKSSSSYRLLPDDTNFLPFQDHTRHLPRPPHIPVPIKQLTKTCSTQSKQNKDTASIPKAKPSCILVYQHNKCTPVIRDSHLNQPKEPQTTPSNQTTAKQPTQKTTPATTHSLQPRKSPLLPTQPASARQTVTHRSSPYYNRQHNYQQYISRPFYNEQPPLLPSPSHTVTSTSKTIPAYTRTFNSTSIYVSSSIITISKSSYHFTAVYICCINTRKKRRHSHQ